MKKLNCFYLTLLFFLFAEYIPAQVNLYSGGFEDNICPAFINGCAPGWLNSHGTADIHHTSINTGPSYSGIYHANMYVKKNDGCLPTYSNDRGEGIMLAFAFEPGTTYQICYAIKGAATNVQWFLTNGLPNFGGIDSCPSSNAIVPDIPSGSQGIQPALTDFDESFWVIEETEEFTPTSSFNQLWFRASNLDHPNGYELTTLQIDDIIIKRVCNILVHPSTDLTACEEDDDFGYIYMDWLPGSDYTADWDLPNSDGIVVTDDEGSVVFNATPGSYSVTITDSYGCTEEWQYDIVEECCEPIPPCPIPDNLNCNYDGGSTIFTWEEVPGAVGYEVSIVGGYPTSCCPNSGGGIIYPVEFVEENSFTLNPALVGNCLSLKVRTVCCGDDKSDYSDIICYSDYECFPALRFGGDDSRKLNKSSVPSPELSPEVFPNPASGLVHLRLNAPGELVLSVEVYDINGQLVKSFAEGHYQDGYFMQNWLVDKQLAEGIYHVLFKTNFGNFQRRVFIAKEQYRQ